MSDAEFHETFYAVDIIRRKRDGQALLPEQMRFMVAGAADGSIADDQLAAWLMACYLRGLDAAETATLTVAMRDSGEKRAGSAPDVAVDKHSTGGVGDKTSFLVAPIAAAAGLLVPMISGRALGHTGGTLDKLESIPGFETQLTLEQLQTVLARAGAGIVGQTSNLVPADRVLYALRDRTGTVESTALLCASIMSKKLAASLDGLVLDVKTGSGAFLKSTSQARQLAALMVNAGEAAGTRTVALVTDMNQPLGRFAGNWLEVEEAFELLNGGRHSLSEDLRELSLTLAGWMLHLGGKCAGAVEGRMLAERLLMNGDARARFHRMVEAQGGDVASLSGKRRSLHRKPVLAQEAGFVTAVDCEAVGWAVQRLGAGREKPGEPVQAMAGMELHAKLGSYVAAGQPMYTMFSDDARRFAEPERMLLQATTIRSEAAPLNPLVVEVVTADTISAATNTFLI